MSVQKIEQLTQMNQLYEIIVDVQNAWLVTIKQFLFPMSLISVPLSKSYHILGFVYFLYLFVFYISLFLNIRLIRWHRKFSKLKVEATTN